MKVSDQFSQTSLSSSITLLNEIQDLCLINKILHNLSSILLWSSQDFESLFSSSTYCLSEAGAQQIFVFLEILYPE